MNTVTMKYIDAYSKAKKKISVVRNIYDAFLESATGPSRFLRWNEETDKWEVATKRDALEKVRGVVGTVQKQKHRSTIG